MENENTHTHARKIIINIPVFKIVRIYKYRDAVPVCEKESKRV